MTQTASTGYGGSIFQTVSIVCTSSVFYSHSQVGTCQKWLGAVLGLLATVTDILTMKPDR